MKLLETYLLYLYLAEKEWNDEDRYADSFNQKNFADLINQVANTNIFRKLRHSLQPSMYSVYVKNALGDYMGRPNSMNAKTLRHMGFKEFKKDMDELIKKAKYAQKNKERDSKTFIQNKQSDLETNDFDDLDADDYGFAGDFDMGDEGTDDGGYGPDTGGGGAE